MTNHDSNLQNKTKDLNKSPILKVSMGVKRGIADFIIIILASMGVCLIIFFNGIAWVRWIGIGLMVLALVTSLWRGFLYKLLKKLGL